MFRNKRIEKLERRIDALERDALMLDERTVIEVRLDYNPYFDPRFPVNEILQKLISILGYELRMNNNHGVYLQKIL